MLDIKRGGLWRDACGHGIGVDNAHALSRAEPAEWNRSPVSVENDGLVRYNKSNLAFHIIRISCVKKPVSQINGSDASGKNLCL